jgi:hypothetical protein
MRHGIAFCGIALSCAVALSLSCAKSKRRAPSETAAGPATPTPIVSPDVLTQHGDSQRTGATLGETRLTPATVGKVGAFGRLFEWVVDGQLYAQPLYVSGVKVNERTVDLVIAATMRNAIHAFEAPAPDSAQQPDAQALWSLTQEDLGEPLPWNYTRMDWDFLGYNISDDIGITATPVVDRETNTLYATVKYRLAPDTFDAGYRLVAVDITTGKVTKKVEIDARVVDAKRHLQRASLLLANKRVYLAFGSHQDTKPYHGWILAYDRGLTLEKTFCTTCGREGSQMGGIWQAGGGLAADEAGNVYAMTGNGSFGPPLDLSNSFIKLDPDLKYVGSWTPANYACLDRTDADLGSAGPMYVKEAATVVGGGKEGVLYALTAGALTGSQKGAGTPAPKSYEPCKEDDPAPDATDRKTYFSIQATPLWEFHAFMEVLALINGTIRSHGYHHIHGSPAAWTANVGGKKKTLVYVSAERDLLRAHAFDGTFPEGAAPLSKPKDTFHSHCTNSDKGMPGGFLTVSADGDKPETGIVWASMPRKNKNALTKVVPGILRAYRAYPESGRELKEIWNSDQETSVNTSADCKEPKPRGSSQVGNFAKGVPPTVARGKVYLATFSDRLAVYGLRPRLAPSAMVARALAAKPYDAALERGDLPDTAAPGEAVDVRIRARNTGPTAWRPEDGVRLDSRGSSEGASAVQDVRALTLDREVPPGGEYTFAFRWVAPREDIYFLRWQLVRQRSEDSKQDLEWFGPPSEEWVLTATTAQCAAMRERVKALVGEVARRRAVTPEVSQEMLRLKAEAEAARCKLGMELMDSMGHDH